MKKIIYIFLIILCCGCLKKTEKEQYQSNRDIILNVHDKIKQIDSEEVLIGPIALLYIMGDYLIISDAMSFDKTLHLFDKNNFEYITSFGKRGQGPDEITHIGHIATDEKSGSIYVTDAGKQKIFEYDLDGILMNPHYVPKEKIRMQATQFLDNYIYMNDSVCIGTVIEPIGSSDFKPVVAKWDFVSGNIEKMKYEHPDIKKKRITFAASLSNEVYVECYCYNDLMTICGLDGELKCNIYGPNWSNNNTNEILYFGNVAFCGDKIFALYSGNKAFVDNKTDYPTKFHVFNIKGEYIQTLETGFKICYFCYDEQNNRIVMSLDDEHIQFAYFDLDGII